MYTIKCPNCGTEFYKPSEGNEKCVCPNCGSELALKSVDEEPVSQPANPTLVANSINNKKKRK